MIHLDTNYLIGLLVRGSSEAAKVDQWLVSGETLAASAIAWSEFLNGPVTSTEASQVEVVLQSQIIPFGKAEAALASDLFNKTGKTTRFTLRLSDCRDRYSPSSRTCDPEPVRFQSVHCSRFEIGLVRCDQPQALVRFPQAAILRGAGRIREAASAVWRRLMRAASVPRVTGPTLLLATLQNPTSSKPYQLRVLQLGPASERSAGMDHPSLRPSSVG